jgi:hypothetical protein
MIARIGTTHVQGKTFIEIVLHSGETWGIEVHRENVDDGQAFAGLAAELLSADRKPRREPMVAGEAT